MSQDFFYDGQCRRYIVQFMRIFSSLNIQTGPDSEGTISQRRVPVMYGNPSWQASAILKGNSQNTLTPVPLMSAWVYSLELAPERRRDPAFEGKMQGVEREFVNGEYTTNPGNRFTVERYMPVPYTMTMQLDIWTSNTDTKLQILEQILTIFNPMIQLQQNSNIFDWTSIFEVELTSVTWTNNSMPTDEDSKEVASLQFKMGIWISPPAKLKRQVLIEQIVTDINATMQLPDTEIMRQFENPAACFGDRISRIIVTPGNYAVSIGYHNGFANNELVLLNSDHSTSEDVSWENLLKIYGRLDSNTKIKLKTSDDIESPDGEIAGTITLDPDRPNVAIFSIIPETLPETTLRPINAVIDPTLQWPGKGLPAAEEGQRYLITSWISAGEEPATPENPTHWGELVAYPNDIISYSGGAWGVSFDSSLNTPAIIENINNNTMYKFENGEWQSLYFGIYDAGYWRVADLLEANDDPEDFGKC